MTERCWGSWSAEYWEETRCIHAERNRIDGEPEDGGNGHLDVAKKTEKAMMLRIV